VLASSCTPTGSRVPKSNSCFDGSQMLFWPSSVTSISWPRSRTLPCPLLATCRTYCKPTQRSNKTTENLYFLFLFLFLFFLFFRSPTPMMMWLALSRSASGFPTSKADRRIRAYPPGSRHPNWHAEIGAHDVAGQCFADYFRPFFEGLSKKSTFLDTTSMPIV
jgi:hypothetical protein